MNDQLAKTLGINFVQRGSRGGYSKSDVRISKTGGTSKTKYLFSLSEGTSKKMGEFVRIAPTEHRLYITPGCNDEYGFKLSAHGKNSHRRYTALTANAVGFIDGFLGEHALKYDSELDVYYVVKGE